jgi:hypothetical protein
MFKKLFDFFRNKSILQASIFNKIEEYLVESAEVNFKLNTFPEDISVFGFCVPDSFEDDESKKQLKSSSFLSSYEMLNTFYKRVGMQEIDLNTIDETVGYWYIQIIFFTEAINNSNKYIKYDCHNFLITLANLKGERYDFKMLYYKGAYNNYVKFFTSAESIDAKKPKNEEHKFAIENLEKVVYGICKKMNVEIPSHLQSKYLDSLVIKTPELLDIITLLQLMSGNTLDDDLVKREANEFYNFYKNEHTEYDLHDFLREILEDLEIAHYSDWKFDPEDIEFYISEILQEYFTFDYPEDTYGSDLFPIVQSELKKTGRVLMNVQTFGDSYLYIVVNSDDVKAILEIAQALNLTIELL